MQRGFKSMVNNAHSFAKETNKTEKFIQLLFYQELEGKYLTSTNQDKKEFAYKNFHGSSTLATPPTIFLFIDELLCNAMVCHNIQ